MISSWQPIDTCPEGYVDGKFQHVLFRGHSTSGAFHGKVVVSGWMDSDRRPVQFYHYKLKITEWMPIPT